MADSIPVPVPFLAFSWFIFHDRILWFVNHSPTYIDETREKKKTAATRNEIEEVQKSNNDKNSEKKHDNNNSSRGKA